MRQIDSPLIKNKSRSRRLVLLPVTNISSSTYTKIQETSGVPEEDCGLRSNRVKVTGLDNIDDMLKIYQISINEGTNSVFTSFPLKIISKLCKKSMKDKMKKFYRRKLKIGKKQKRRIRIKCKHL